MVRLTTCLVGMCSVASPCASKPLNRCNRRATAALGLAAALLLVARSAAAQSPIQVAEIGGAYFGGEVVRREGREYFRGQIYLQFVKLTRPRGIPILLWHGGSLTGAVYERTPDGRPGWQTEFLKAGRSVFLVDSFQGGRAGFAPFQDLAALPTFRSTAFAWEAFRIGPPGSYGATARRAFPDTQFPTEAFGSFARGLVPRFPIDVRRDEASYRAVLEAACPCVLITHSAAGPVGFELAARYPALVRALVSVEPSGGPSAGVPPRATPQFVIWGDHLHRSGNSEWAKLYAGSKKYAEAAQRAGASVTWLDLPAVGIKGNSHMLMSDRNSKEIAQRIEVWIRNTLR